MKPIPPYCHRLRDRHAATWKHPLARGARASLVERARAWILGSACVFGSAGLLASTPHPATAYLAVIRQGEESRGAPESGDTFGNAVAVGDFNGDGYDDLAAGAQFEDASGYNHAGMVVVSYGSEYGIKRSGAQALLQSDGDALEANALFGAAVAAGDFDDDGYDDLAIGAPLADVDASHTNTGYVFVYAGGPGGLSYWHYLWQPGGGGSAESNDRFGASLCVGNFDGLPSTNEDLAIGSPGEDGDAGAVFWFTGGSQGLLNGSHGWFKQSTLGGTNVAGDQFGYSLTSGQIQSSGYEELVVGAPFKEVGGTQNAGEVWLLMGSATGPNTATARLIDPGEDDLPHGPYPDGYFGWSVAAGRYWGGDYDGLAIGEPGRSYFGHPGSGRVVVGKGGLFGLSFTNGNDVTFFQDDMGWALGDNDGFGRSLVAGYYNLADGGEDLIIGSPTDDSNGGSSFSGVISVVFGGPSGPGGHGYTGWAQDAFSDDIVSFDDFGRALAVGNFDSTNRGNLAVGAPGEDSNTGQVVIVAPWRQTQYAGSRNSLAVDCEGNWIFAQKPFDEVQIASTTKIMTVLLACERMNLPPNDPLHVDWDTSYTVPDWIRENIGGSRYEFENEQRLHLWDLLYCCVYPSGNDAAYAIADLLTGGNNTWTGAYDTTCPIFVAQMNLRAEQLGMTHTHFTNPAGLDKGLPHSCAADMAKLAAAAMENENFRTIVGSTSHTFTTSAVIPPIRYTYEDTITYGWLQGMRNYNSLFDGIKPGRTPRAKRTAVFSVLTQFDAHPALAVSLGHLTRPSIRETGAALMDLAWGACGGTFASRDGQDGAPLERDGVEDGFRVNFGPLSTFLGDHSGGAAELVPPANPDAAFTQIELLRPTGSGLTSCRLELLRSAELELAPGAQATMGIGPFQSHGGLAFINHGESTVTILVNTSHTGTPIAMTLDPGERETIAPYTGSEVNEFVYTIQNPSTHLDVSLGVMEDWIWDKTGIPVGPAPFFSPALRQSDALLDQAFRVHVTGTDSQSGQMVYVSVHDPGMPADAPTPPLEPIRTERVRVLQAWPNPFAGSTRLGFDLGQPGDVRLEIFDSSGRRVRAFERTGAPAGPGAFEWDGRSASGHEVAPGIYLYRVEQSDHGTATGRVTLLR
jgi:D-alanyl-D-alanine carboxypeptidase